MSMNVVGRILSLKPDGGVSSCEIYYFHILMFASEGLRVDLHNFEILITVGIFFNINESLMYATFFQKCETLPTPPTLPPSLLLPLNPFRICAKHFQVRNVLFFSVVNFS